METAVLSEIVNSTTHRGLTLQAFFRRTLAGTEVDIVVESDGKLVPIEVKLSATPRPGHERTQCPIFSLDITWPSLESIRPRSTIRSNASSRRISSYVASSGCDSMTSFIFSFTIAMDSLLHLRHNDELSGAALRRPLE